MEFKGVPDFVQKTKQASWKPGATTNDKAEAVKSVLDFTSYTYGRHFSKTDGYDSRWRAASVAEIVQVLDRAAER